MAHTLMRILVTRPQEDAKATAEKLRALGHDVLIAPLLEVTQHVGGTLDLWGIQALLITSANGVRALARRTAERAIPVFAVGPQTSAEAAALGFVTIHNANGDATALAELVVETTTPDKGALLHASGVEGAGHLAVLLEEWGFNVSTETLYSVSGTALPDDAISAIVEGTIDAVLLYSPRTARAFRDALPERAHAALGRMIAICISQASADALAPLTFKDIRIASAPNQEALLACLG